MYNNLVKDINVLTNLIGVTSTKKLFSSHWNTLLIIDYDFT